MTAALQPLESALLSSLPVCPVHGVVQTHVHLTAAGRVLEQCAVCAARGTPPKTTRGSALKGWLTRLEARRAAALAKGDRHAASALAGRIRASRKRLEGAV